MSNFFRIYIPMQIDIFILEAVKKTKQRSILTDYHTEDSLLLSLNLIVIPCLEK